MPFSRAKPSRWDANVTAFSILSGIALAGIAAVVTA
jgi:hypothetical protein